MTYTVHDPRAVYAAVVTRIATQTGKNIGRGEAPSTTTPYAVVYPVTDPSTGTLGDPEQIVLYEFQVTSVGDTAEQAEWMQTEVRTALLGWTPTVTGFSFGPVARSGGIGTSRNDNTQPPKFTAVDTFSLFAS